MKDNKIFKEDDILEYSRDVFYGVNQRTSLFEQYLRYYYLGGDSLSDNNLKRLFGEINTILSLIFTPSYMIIEPICEEVLNKEQKALLEALIKEVYDNFITYNRLDIEIEEAILHALILGYTPIKVYWKGQGVIYKEINPVNFGLYYESLDIDDRQQIIGHKTFMTKDKIKYLYKIDVEMESKITQEKLPQSNFAELINVAKQKSVIDASKIGYSDKYWSSMDAKNLEEVKEIYINEYYKTGQDNWHKFVVLPRFNIIVDHIKLTGIRHPFFLLVLYPAYGSSLGVSLIEMVKEIQNKRIECLNKIDQVTDLKTEPPLVVRGAAVSPDQLREDLKQLRTPNGLFVIQDPQAHFEPYPPQTGLPEMYDLVEYWNSQLKFVTGLYEVLMGEAHKARFGKGFELFAAFMTSVFRKVAHRIETTLEDIFTYTAYLYQLNYDKTIKIGENYYKFADFPFDFRINIKSHTASPIDMKIIQDTFFAMYKMGDIPADMLFDLFNLPFKSKYEEFKKEKAMAMLLAQSKKAEEEKK